MGFQNLVLPFDEDLIGRLPGRALVVRVDDPSVIDAAADFVKRSKSRLSAVILDSSVPMDLIHFSETRVEISLVIFAPSMGEFRNLASRLATIRAVNPLICLPAHDSENLTATRILSAVNVRAGAVIDQSISTNWETLSDLMTYALLGAAAHAPIEPFAFISTHYQPTGWVRWGSAFFDDPKDFLHLDRKGRISLTHGDLITGKFIGDDIEHLDEIAASDAFREKTDPFKHFFLTYHPCSRCPGWRVCLGRFADNVDDLDGCSSFFSEMIDLLQHYKPRPEAPRKENNDHRHL